MNQEQQKGVREGGIRSMSQLIQWFSDVFALLKGGHGMAGGIRSQATGNNLNSVCQGGEGNEEFRISRQIPLSYPALA